MPSIVLKGKVTGKNQKSEEERNVLTSFVDEPNICERENQFEARYKNAEKNSESKDEQESEWKES